MSALIDTNILVYRFDHRDARKQQIAQQLLRDGVERDSIRVPHQAILEFVSATTRTMTNPGGQSLLPRQDALLEAESMLAQFTILYPNESIVRLAVRGAATYQLNWFDAHLWAYAEHFGLAEIISEDFSNGQLLGSVRISNPF
jgi:predicted nucleic acid-binding protein